MYNSSFYDIPTKLLNSTADVLEKSNQVTTLNIRKKIEGKYNVMVDIDVINENDIKVFSTMNLPNELIQDAINLLGESKDLITPRSITMDLSNWNNIFC